MISARTHAVGSRRCFLVFLLAGFACGCKVAEPTRESLDTRVRQYWDYRLAGDWNRIYGMISSQEKKSTSKEAFLRDNRDAFRSSGFQIEAIEVSGMKGEATVRQDWRMQLPVGGGEGLQKGSSRMKESWVFEKDDWYINLTQTRVFGDMDEKK